ncbi:MAG TPA: FtsX-like permease family protein [bacterium]|nr:FtsX-like permease family protein [bacterium]
MRILPTDKLLKIAFKNVFRNKRRTLLTLGVLIAGGAGLIVMGGYFENLMHNLGEKIIHAQTGHLQIDLKNYYKLGVTDPLGYLMQDSEDVRRKIESVPHVMFTVPRLSFSGMISTDKTSMAVSINGTDPFAENRMGSFMASNAKIPSIAIKEGRELDPAHKEEILLGVGLMKALDLKLGDWVMLLTTREEGAVDGNRFRVVGVFETVMRESDNRSVKINVAAAQGMLGAPGKLHSLQAVLDKTENTEAARKAVVAALGGKDSAFEVLTWEEMSAYYRQGKELFRKIFVVITLIFGVVFFFSAGNSVSMSLMERTREFGTMMAIGNSRSAILFVILLETLVLGVIAGALSLVCGVGLAKIITAIGIEMPPTPNASTGTIAVISVTAPLLLKSFFLTVVSAFLASVPPAYRTTKIRIVEALGYV